MNAPVSTNRPGFRPDVTRLVAFILRRLLSALILGAVPVQADSLIQIGWSVNGGPRPILVMDVATGRTTERGPGNFASGSPVSDVTDLGLGGEDGDLWALGYSVNRGPRPLIRLRAADGAIVSTTTTELSPSGVLPDLVTRSLTYGDGWIYGLGTSINGGRRPLHRIHPDTGRITRSVVTELGPFEADEYRPMGMAYGNGSLWCLARNSGDTPQLRRLDPATGRILLRVAVGRDPKGALPRLAEFGMAHGDGSLWMLGSSVNSGPRPIYRIDPMSGRILSMVETDRRPLGSSDSTVFGLVYCPALTIEATAGPGGVAMGGGRFEPGTDVRLEARPDACHSLDGWYVGGDRVSRSRQVSFQATNSARLEARFITRTVAIAGECQPADGGSIRGTGTWPCGQPVTVTAVPAPNHRFVRWLQGGTELGREASLTISPTEPSNLVAEFVEVVVPAPTLAIGRGPGPQVTLRWTDLSGLWVLESCASLPGGNDWRWAPGSPTTSNGVSLVTLQPASGGMWFRLRKP